MTTTLKTWGSAMASLKAALHEASSSKPVKDVYGSMAFPAARALAIHRGFSAWCTAGGMNPQAIRLAMTERFERRCQTVLSIPEARTLLYSLPDEFNVRGVWTPEVK